MNGLVVYCKNDYIGNESFVEWLISEFKKYNANLRLLFVEDFEKSFIRQREIDFVINRSRDYNISLLFELNGIRVYNSSKVTLLGNNKLAGYAYAKQKGYPFAEVLLPNSENACTVISKPIYGHGGKGIKLLDKSPFWLPENVNQRYLEDMVGDIRFYILENKVFCAVLRKAKDGFLSNFSQGGDVSFYSCTEKEKKFVEDFISELSVDYAGIDFLLAKDGSLYFNEIEDAVGSRMLTRLGKNTIIPIWIENIVRQCKDREK